MLMNELFPIDAAPPINGMAPVPIPSTPMPASMSNPGAPSNVSKVMYKLEEQIATALEAHMEAFTTAILAIQEECSSLQESFNKRQVEIMSRIRAIQDKLFMYKFTTPLKAQMEAVTTDILAIREECSSLQESFNTGQVEIMSSIRAIERKLPRETALTTSSTVASSFRPSVATGSAAQAHTTRILAMEEKLSSLQESFNKGQVELMSVIHAIERKLLMYQLEERITTALKARMEAVTTDILAIRKECSSLQESFNKGQVETMSSIRAIERKLPRETALTTSSTVASSSRPSVATDSAAQAPSARILAMEEKLSSLQEGFTKGHVETMSGIRAIERKLPRETALTTSSTVASPFRPSVATGSAAPAQSTRILAMEEACLSLEESLNKGQTMSGIRPIERKLPREAALTTSSTVASPFRPSFATGSAAQAHQAPDTAVAPAPRKFMFQEPAERRAAQGGAPH